MASKGRDDNALEAERELAFAPGSDRLPWLESDDDEEPSGVDTGRLVAFAVVGLMAVVVLLGVLWWFTREHTDAPQIAEGNVIAAPPGPYKVKPANPGGRQVAGTGDTSFEVAEGKQVEGRIAETPAPKPSIDVDKAASPKATPTLTKEASGIGVQVGAYSSQAKAEAGWAQLAGRLVPLHGRNHRIIEGTADSGTVFRLQALAGNVSEANALCASIKTAGGDCQVKH